MSSLVFPWRRDYRREWLRGDLVAGLTVWAVLVPEALAYATIAGVSPVVGLYAAPGALLLYAAFGSSRHLVVGPMSATAALSAATVGDVVASGSDAFTAMTVALAICVGIVALAAGLARLGFLAALISEPVLKGFIVGLALTIVIGQVPKLLGIDKEPGDFFEQAWGVLSRLGEIHLLTLVVGVLSLLLVLGLRRVAPAVPGSLVAVLVSVVAVAALNLDEHGLDIVGTVESGLPAFGLPDGLSAHDYGDLAAGAVGVMLVGFAEGLGAAKAYAARHDYAIDANRELVGLGAANLASGLSSGMVVNGSLSKTAVNGAAGARSQLSGLVAAAMTVLTLLLLTGLFEQLPDATLAAIVIAAVIELVDLPALRRLYATYAGRLGGFANVTARPDFVAAIAALLGVLVFDTLQRRRGPHRATGSRRPRRHPHARARRRVGALHRRHRHVDARSPRRRAAPPWGHVAARPRRWSGPRRPASRRRRHRPPPPASHGTRRGRGRAQRSGVSGRRARRSARRTVLDPRRASSRRTRSAA